MAVGVSGQEATRIGIPVYERVNLLNVAGPMELFYWARVEIEPERSLETILISEDGGGVTSINGVRFDAHATFAGSPAIDVLWVPGGHPTALERMMAARDTPHLSFPTRAAPGARWICSVCEGALLLARAGLLDGHRATTHWRLVECLKRFPAIEVDKARERFVVSGNRITGGGISSGLDEALKLVALLFGKQVANSVQSATQYFPKPAVMAELPLAVPACIMSWPGDPGAAPGR